jgi:putative SOS response-associated peptidase YedK
MRALWNAGVARLAGHPITNICNVKSSHWRLWLGESSHCAVPWTSFCQYAPTKPRKTPTWFALSKERPAGILRRHLNELARQARHQN